MTTMTDESFHPEPPFRYECIDCQERFVPDDIPDHDPTDELIVCPDCGGTLRNVSTSSRE